MSRQTKRRIAVTLSYLLIAPVVLFGVLTLVFWVLWYPVIYAAACCHEYQLHLQEEIASNLHRRTDLRLATTDTPDNGVIDEIPLPDRFEPRL